MDEREEKGGGVKISIFSRQLFRFEEGGGGSNFSLLSSFSESSPFEVFLELQIARVCWLAAAQNFLLLFLKSGEIRLGTGIFGEPLLPSLVVLRGPFQQKSNFFYLYPS